MLRADEFSQLATTSKSQALPAKFRARSHGIHKNSTAFMNRWDDENARRQTTTAQYDYPQGVNVALPNVSQAQIATLAPVIYDAEGSTGASGPHPKQKFSVRACMLVASAS
jgi:hypothetical protein